MFQRLIHKHAPSFVTTVAPWRGGGGGVLPNVSYIGMCCCEGYGFKQFSLGSKKIICYYLKMKIKLNPIKFTCNLVSVFKLHSTGQCMQLTEVTVTVVSRIVMLG